MKFIHGLGLWTTGLVTSMAGICSAQCNADNCLRAFRNPTNSAYGSSYCSSILQTTAVTTTTTTTTRTVTAAPSVIIVSTTTYGQTSTVTVTTTRVGSAAKLKMKKMIKPRAPDPAPTPTSSIYSACSSSPARVSSACSCLIGTSTQGTKAATTTQTQTVITSTTPVTTSTSTIDGGVTTTTTTTTATVAGATCQVGDQVVKNPSFETASPQNYPISWDRTSTQPDYQPISVGFFTAFDGQRELYYKIETQAGIPQTQSVLQILYGVGAGNCANKNFLFSLAVGIDNAGSTPPIDSTVEVKLGGVTVAGPAPPCQDGSGAGCILRGGGSYYRVITVPSLKPAVPNPVLEIIVKFNPQSDAKLANVIVDSVSLTVTP